MAIDDAFQEKIDIALQNRAQLPPVEVQSNSTVTTQAKTSEARPVIAQDHAEWIVVGLIWVALTVALILLARWTRHDWRPMVRWIRRACIWLGVICLFGSLVSVRDSEPWRVFWIATSWWPALLGLAVLAVRLVLLSRPTPPRS